MHEILLLAIDAAHKGFLFYASGVFYDPECGKFVYWKTSNCFYLNYIL
jgi:hypothetical protein